MSPPQNHSLLLYNIITENSVIIFLKLEKLRDYILSKIQFKCEIIFLIHSLLRNTRKTTNISIDCLTFHLLFFNLFKGIF
ncbi:hypothetical protein COK35_29660 [Bacillus cereus]|nr:hypothetical protein COK35_29660 [Bacillus cereus]